MDAAAKRRKAGDASQIEVNVARADLADVQRQLSAATTDAAKAQARLRVRFPRLVTNPPTFVEPVPLEYEEATWREIITRESDELRIAEEELKRAELTAARARADQIADPTVGVFTASEAFRNERIVGINLSIPFGGRYRTAATRESLQLAESARSAVEVQRVEIDSLIAENVADADGSLKRWNASVEGAAAARDSARLSQRAYTFGELDLQSLLLARRQSLAAALDSAQARVAALKARYRLLVDARLIWGLRGE
jgi:outer membrane protein TolC